MSVSGNIRSFPLADLLQWLSLSRKSGVLSIIAADYNVRLFVWKGVLVTAETTDASRRIGQYLIARGYIDEDHLMAALDMQTTGSGERRLGEILCAQGYATRDSLIEALHERTKEMVYDLFLLESALFSFEPIQDAPVAVVELNLNLDSLVLEGIRRKDEWARIRKVLPDDSVWVSLRAKAKPVMAELPEIAPFLTDLLHCGQTIGELIMKTRRSAFDVYLCLYRMLEMKCLNLSQAPARPAETPHAVRNLQEAERQISDLLRNGEFAQARQTLQDLENAVTEPKWFHRMEAMIDLEEQAFLHRYFGPKAIPVLGVDRHQLEQAELSPKEGFLLSRLGEGMTIKNLGQIMPLAEIEILRLLYGLFRKGIIRLGN